MSPIRQRHCPIAGLLLSESALTQLWLRKGYAELAPSEQSEAWRNPK
jgi:hypothetical protein